MQVPVTAQVHSQEATCHWVLTHPTRSYKGLVPCGRQCRVSAILHPRQHLLPIDFLIFVNVIQFAFPWSFKRVGNLGDGDFGWPFFFKEEGTVGLGKSPPSWGFIFLIWTTETRCFVVLPLDYNPLGLGPCFLQLSIFSSGPAPKMVSSCVCHIYWMKAIIHQVVL